MRGYVISMVLSKIQQVSSYSSFSEIIECSGTTLPEAYLKPRQTSKVQVFGEIVSP